MDKRAANQMHCDLTSLLCHSMSRADVVSVLKKLHDVTADQQVLRRSNELPVRFACVICAAVLPIRPMGNQDHHQATFLDKNRMTVHARYLANMFLHQVENFLHGDIRHGLSFAKGGLSARRLIAWTFLR